MPHPLIKFYTEKESKLKLVRECVGLIIAIINDLGYSCVIRQILKSIDSKRDYKNVLKSMGYVQAIISLFSQHHNDASIYLAERRLTDRCLLEYQKFVGDSKLYNKEKGEDK